MLEDVFDCGLLDWLDDLPDAYATLLNGCLDSGLILSDDIFDAAATAVASPGGGGGGGGAPNVSAAEFDYLLMQAAVARQPVPAAAGAARAAAASLESPFMMTDTATAAAGKDLYHPVLAKRSERLPSQILQQQQQQQDPSLISSWNQQLPQRVSTGQIHTPGEVLAQVQTAAGQSAAAKQLRRSGVTKRGSLDNMCWNSSAKRCRTATYPPDGRVGGWNGGVWR